MLIYRNIIGSVKSCTRRFSGHFWQDCCAVFVNFLYVYKNEESNKLYLIYLTAKRYSFDKTDPPFG